MNEKILQFLNSNDPLSDEAFKYVINYQEEDQNIDYKLNFDYSSEREQIQINEPLRLAIVKFSIICQVPYFYWLRDTSNSDIKDMIIQGLHEHKPGLNTFGFFKLAQFLGKNYFEKIINNFPKHTERLSSTTKFFQGFNLKSNFNSSTVEPVIKSMHRNFKVC